ncbi:hypothetical protein C2R22_24595 (plasmid) [Salinigranum rubrum]|uniref:Helix-hairpin-helix DNA-binding motif class 1 domain-containing protein n=1 Tax=Salinigranum rubrum TaxID=755307 RepID=A0A2I8VS11_9EURY|nr:helix-hairpin-helix domain-containing protein [Salinigranum rubrum]AUV84711.1 hypothetical protein C2R22_24595 [Salinigranum rubrum]
MTVAESLAGFAIVALALVAMGYERFVEWRTVEEGTVEYVQRQYERGEIDLAELERRLDVVADREAQRIRESVERVSGIGEATSWSVAEEFSSLREVRDASVEELQSVSGVGEKRALAIRERL